ncbi:phosphatidate cytidylyltransferase [Oxalobacteraceae bacterium R-40]|uniref:Phosphatidate cytidylyltransferase n=1 Tax=Keguizhuia sedimenti TaxID=3064264 RepID=A0ABU1BU01_9BURK|nr:phosphatidate cytidylyltransferase [Oxalobacteraceae bacterium R-40]
MLRTRIITALLLLAVLLVVLKLGFVAFAIFAGIFFAAAAWETLRLFHSKNPIVGAVIWTVLFALFLLQDRSGNMNFLFALCVAIWVFRLVPSLSVGLPSLEGIGNRLLGAVYGLAVLGSFLAAVMFYRQSASYLFSVLVLVWIADVGAYFFGKAFGKRKLAPSISPGKSWEGAIGGGFAVIAAAVAMAAVPMFGDTFAAQIQNAWGWFGLVVAMTVIVAASVTGDLFESQLKRRAGMKDSSGLLPGHGGVLDRVDALIPVLPLAMLIHARI